MTWKRQCGDILQGTELQNLVERFNGNGVLSGLAITASGIPDMETHVASGSWFAGETKQTKGTATDITHTAADGSNDRYDIVYATTSNTISHTEGTPAADPVVPDLPADSILLAIVYIATGDAQIVTADINDCRLDRVSTDWDMDTNKITNVTDPASAQDAATKNYVDERLPSGTIVMWHGTIANIPTGWVICDGNNSTPNLLDRFVQGVATAATDPGTTGGATSKTTGGPSENFATGSSGSQRASQNHTHTISDIRPKYYEIAFIMKT